MYLKLSTKLLQILRFNERMFRMNYVLLQTIYCAVFVYNNEITPDTTSNNFQTHVGFMSFKSIEEMLMLFYCIGYWFSSL